MIYLIGAGGVGSWLTPSLALLVGGKNITLVDGDKLERKNLNRQLFTKEDIGKFKADALAHRYGCHSLPRWFSFGMMALGPSDVLLCAVDNHPARKEALRTADYEGCPVIIGANETTSAEAYAYQREWRDTNLDPRVYYPEIVADPSNDPRSAAIGCTGEAQEQNPQLVSANFMAAALMQQLFMVWVLEYRKFDEQAKEHLPHKLVSNLTRLSSNKAGVPALIERTEQHGTTTNTPA